MQSRNALDPTDPQAGGPLRRARIGGNLNLPTTLDGSVTIHEVLSRASLHQRSCGQCGDETWQQDMDGHSRRQRTPGAAAVGQRLANRSRRVIG